jgi:hypothetical protein
VNKYEDELYFKVHGLEVKTAGELNAALERALAAQRTEVDSAEEATQGLNKEPQDSADE